MRRTPATSWTPHVYQQRAIEVMMKQASVGLFLDPGLGKTSTVLAAYSILQEQRLVNSMLIVAPLRPMYSTWPAEIGKWEDFNHLSYSIIHGSVDARREAVKKRADIYLINPEGLVWLLTSYPDFVKSLDVLCVDESSKFKATNTKRFKSLRPFIPTFQRRWCLTGTPTPNGIMDLFGQIYILDQGASLGRYITHFRNKYFYQTGYGGYTWTPLPGSFEQIIEKTAPLVLQLNAKDHLEMPALMPVVRNVEMPAKARDVYKAIEDDFLVTLGEETLIAANAAAAGTKCRQIANGAVYTNDEGDYSEVHDAKLDELEDLLEELAGAPTLLLYEFKHDAERIEARFGHPNITGKSPKQSDKLINQFNAGSIPCLLGHPASMGHGLNLQSGCHHVIWFGIPWNLEHYDQAIARVYRQGQQSGTVFVYHIVATGTLDETVMEVLAAKDRNQQKLLKALAAGRSN